jgi:hypothetical protein
MTPKEDKKIKNNESNDVIDDNDSNNNNNNNNNHHHNNAKIGINHDNSDNNDNNGTNDNGGTKDFVSDLRMRMNNQDILNAMNNVKTNINNVNFKVDRDDDEVLDKPQPSRKFSLSNAISHSVSQILNFSYQPLHNSAPFTGIYIYIYLLYIYIYIYI